MASDFSSYVGCFITLISHSEIRYEGFIHWINSQARTISLKHARCYGTEGRRRYGSEILLNPDVFALIVFRFRDIKEYYDTRAWFSQSLPSPLVGQYRPSTVPIQFQDTIGRPFRHSHSSSIQNTIGRPFRHSHSSLMQNTVGRLSHTIPSHEPNHIETPFRHSHSSPMQNTIGCPSLTLSAHEPNHNETSPNISQSSKYPTLYSPSIWSPQLIRGNQAWDLDSLSTSTYKTISQTSHVSSPSAHTTVMTSISSLPPVLPETGHNKAHIIGQSVPNTAVSFGGSTSGPPLTLLPFQLSESGANVPSTMRLSADPRDLATPTQLTHNSLGSIDSLEHQAHLLTSPIETRTQITGQSVPNTASSFEDSASVPPLTLPPSSLSPYQLSESGSNVPSPMKLCDDPRDLAATLTHLPHNSLESTDPLEHQAPLLPSPRETPTQEIIGNLQQTGNPDLGGNGVGRGSNNQSTNNQGHGIKEL